MAQRGKVIHKPRRSFCKTRPSIFVKHGRPQNKTERFQRLGSMAEWLRSGLQIRFAACFHSLFFVKHW